MFARLMTASALAFAAVPLHAQAAPPPSFDQFLVADRAAEIATARSAAPPIVSDSATVLVLARKGYFEAIHGTNGFTCVVMRSMADPLDSPDLYSPVIRAPHCFNAAAAQTVMPTMLRQTEWIMAGVKPTEVRQRLEHGYATHEFPPPAPGAMAYMLSPEMRLAVTGTHWLPHLMFFFDKSVAPSTWGAAAQGSPIIDGSASDPKAFFLTLFVPVRQWSDGKTAMLTP